MDEIGESGWVSYRGEGQHGHPADSGNDHLTAEQRQLRQRQADERARRRGRHEATIVVYVYENGEADPQVSFPEGSTIDLWDRPKINACVAAAAAALADWR